MRPSRALFLFVVGSAISAAACGGGDHVAGGRDPNDPGKPGELIDNGFESDDPSGKSSGGGSKSEGAADAGAAAPSASDSSNGAAQRSIEEADIIKVDGARLYALSRYGGLSIIDIGDPDHMRVLGRKRTDGMPFEMYVRNGRAYVMLNDMGRWVPYDTEDGYYGYGTWQQTSEILALDVTNASAISEVTHYDVPGSIADSRIVGDALYLVTYENGYCWNCQKTPATIVTSFNVAGSAISKVDAIAFGGSTNSYSWQRSVSASNQRLYIAGPEWNWTPGQQNGSSVIQVVDITDPNGALHKGADIPVAGQINNRWQIDENEGVLRVISQSGNGWGNGPNPRVQTFTIQNSSSIVPLGATDIVLPQLEQLNSVRFDGPRAYAITSERKDPLFTIDLSDPANPKQAGELTMPGFIFYMEPRGDRLIGFGYDDTNRGSAGLSVSLFDVSNIAQPKMLQRVSFGNGWGQVAEDMDRIHKSVQVLDDAGLVLVPFASYGYWMDGSCSKSQSGIQLIDYTRDSLTLRGIAPQYGMPRRAILTGTNRLLGVSDRTVTSFDITSHDAPVKKHDVDLSTPAYRTVELGNHVAALSSDWWSGEVMLSLTPKGNPDDADITGKVSLASLAPPDQAKDGCSPSSWTDWYGARLFANGPTVYVTLPIYSYDYGSNGSTRSGKVVVAAIDTTDPANPKIAGKADMPLTTRTSQYGGWYGGLWWDGWDYYSYYGGSILGSGAGVIQHGSRLAYLEIDNEYVPKSKGTPYGYSYDVIVHRKLHVADLANPTAPVVLGDIDLGESLGSSPLYLQNGVALTTRWVQSTLHPNKVRFFVDRVDLKTAVPQQMSSLNVPGSLLLADEPTNRFVTTDYTVTRTPGSDWSDCQTRVGWRAYFDYEAKECVLITRQFKLSNVVGSQVSLLQTVDPPSQSIGGVSVTDDRIYITHEARYDYSSQTYCAGCPYEPPTLIEKGGLWVYGGIRAGQMSLVSELSGQARWPLAVKGTKIAVYTENGLSIFDTSTPKGTLVTQADLRGWGYTSNVLLSDDHAVCSLGEFGLQTLHY